MRKLSFFIVFILFISFNIKAQTPKFSVGIDADLFSVPLTNYGLEQTSSGVFVSYYINSKMYILARSQNSILLNNDTNLYERNIAYQLGLGYFFKEDTVTSISFQLLYGNSLLKKVSFNEHCIDGSVHFYFYKIFYLTTGVKMFHIENTNFTNLPNYNINWYWQIGFRLLFGKK